jgi:hypothetical protein
MGMNLLGTICKATGHENFSSCLILCYLLVTGKRLAAKLSAAGIDTTYVLLASVSQVLSGVTKVNTLFNTVPCTLQV